MYTFAQSYDYIIKLIWKGKNNHFLFDNWMVIICKSPKDDLCQVWLKLAQLFWRIGFLNLNPFYPRMLCAKFGWSWPIGSGEEEEDGNVKNLQRDRRTDRLTDRRRTTGDQKSSLEFQDMWAKKHKKFSSRVHHFLCVTCMLHINMAKNNWTSLPYVSMIRQVMKF